MPNISCKNDKKLRFETMLRFQRVLGKTPGIMLPKEQLLVAIFPEAVGNEKDKIIRFNLNRRLKLNLKQGVMIKTRRRLIPLENPKTVYGLRQIKNAI